MSWLLGALLLGCATEDWRNADLQLDATGADLGLHPDEVRLRICVDGAGNNEDALGAGLVAFPGLPAGEPLTITADTLSDDEDEVRTGRVGPVVLDEDEPYRSLPWQPCSGEGCAACQTSGDLAAPGDLDWLLAVRFVDL